MIHELTNAVRYCLGKDVAGRSVAVFPDDTFIVSYPRSGNTWTRFLIANLMSPGEPVTFRNIERLVPDIHAQSRRFLRGIPRPRVLKSHEYFDPRYSRVVYIVRDPRDVVVSAYHFHRKQRQIAEGYPIENYVRDFIAGAVFRVYASWAQNASSWLSTAGAAGPDQPSACPFGSWAYNVSGWTEALDGAPGFLLLRYEDMMEKPQRELAKIARLMNIDPTPEGLTSAVERSSPDRMRELERAESKDWVMTRDTRQDIPFVRAPGSGGWRSALPAESVAELERAWGGLMKSLGYELAASPSHADGRVAVPS